MLLDWLGLSIGAALGAISRFFVTNYINRFWHFSFPIATFSINLVGAFALASLYARNNGTNHMLYLFTFGIGFLGSFTTFSTFMYESSVLMDRRAVVSSLSYLSLSVILGIFFAWSGRHIL